MATWARAIHSAAVWLRTAWLSAHLLAFWLLHQGYASTHCGAGYIVTWVDYAAIAFLQALAFPWMHLPTWLQQISTPREPLNDALQVLLPHVADDLCFAALLSVNFQLVAVPLELVASLARHRFTRSAPSIPLPNER